MKPKTIILAEGERIIAIVPEYRAGPGWSNTPTWVYIDGRDGKLREECIQPDERTPALYTLFSLGASMHCALMDAVPVRIKKAAKT